MGFFSFFSKEKKETLDKGLSKTKESVFGKIARAVAGKSKVDDEVLDNLEEVLITSDVGVETTLKIIERIEKRAAADKYMNATELNHILRDEIAALLTENNSEDVDDFEAPIAKKPYVIMVVGVNGVGKTTTIGKLAYQFKQAGKKVYLGAADTFRAAAVEQLVIWGERVGVPVVKQKMGADPASVAFDTLSSATANNADVVIIDTAGRLHNKVGLMNELTKIKNVMKKVVPDAPNEVLLVLDGSTGQNAFEQAKQFTLATEVTAMAVTKLDGTAKGGVVIGISDQFKIPVKYIGLGEGMEDLQVFRKKEFVDSLRGECMKRKTIDIITLGCSKNLVDSEHLMRQLEEVGFHVTHDAERPKGQIAVINTCGFIGDAKEESINMILEFAQAKEEGNLEKLYVMGCLSERYLKELAVEIPQVDKFYGKFNWRELLQDLGKAYHDELHIERTLTTPKHYAYLKISEGCDRKCSYCAIPIITGRHVSRPMEEILDEVKYLVARGVKEFQVIAQELTYYGVDLYKKQMLPELVERISDIPGVEWIRLHYAYPAHFPTDLFRVMRERDNVCKYMDIALQHISDNMLQKMRRHVTKDETYKLIEQFREEVPGIHLRTTLMVGHPGETEADFEELKEFVRKVRFDRMGAFAYSEEEGTYAAAEYEDSIPQEVKQARLDELMSIQQGISGELSAEKVGRQMKVIIDRLEGEYYIGRTEFDSPEVDPEVLIERGDRALHIGNFYHVEIVNSDDFDLFGRII